MVTTGDPTSIRVLAGHADGLERAHGVPAGACASSGEGAMGGAVVEVRGFDLSTVALRGGRIGR